MGVWIETCIATERAQRTRSHPVWVCGLKLRSPRYNTGCLRVTPCMGVWIETSCPLSVSALRHVTPCMGVWIETSPIAKSQQTAGSHPVWVCGLKPTFWSFGSAPHMSHPVWVCGLKLNFVRYNVALSAVTPCMGVWIETCACRTHPDAYYVTPCMGVWIETASFPLTFVKNLSHPVWVCGLKLNRMETHNIRICHTLYGCVD